MEVSHDTLQDLQFGVRVSTLSIRLNPYFQSERKSFVSVLEYVFRAESSSCTETSLRLLVAVFRGTGSVSVGLLALMHQVEPQLLSSCR